MPYIIRAHLISLEMAYWMDIIVHLQTAPAEVIVDQLIRMGCPYVH